MKKIAIVNGPNLNLLGTRETDTYGSESFDAYFQKLRTAFPDIDFLYYQSNVEGELIQHLQSIDKDVSGIIMNPAGYSHTSVALADTIAAITTKVVEVHISNIYARESFRHTSLTGARCAGVISGFGLKGYELAVRSFIEDEPTRY